jgi:hypothetical protein
LGRSAADRRKLAIGAAGEASLAVMDMKDQRCFWKAMEELVYPAIWQTVKTNRSLKEFTKSQLFIPFG